MSVFTAPDFDNHEKVAFFSDPDSGLKAIIAIHSTVLGPAVGGCRMWKYKSEQDAINDVLRLSRGMSYKNAMADLGLGGGKSVIYGDSHTDKTPTLFRAFGRAVESMGGKYITAEDVGIDVADLQIVKTETEHVAGLAEGRAAASGDPSPYTAHGVFYGIKAAVEFRMKKKDLEGVNVNVQGVGHVGYPLCKELHAAGAVLTITDIHKEHVERAVREFGATAVGLDEIYAAEGDVFAPCALGAILNDDTIPKLKVKIIAGSANNQLAKNGVHGEELRKRGILYCPDYVINAGGIINVANEVHGRVVKPAEGMKKVEELYGVLMEVFTRAETTGQATAIVADHIAEQKIQAAKKAA
jgi:leucine dehydrogenase